jgi:hypothetical protein
MTAFVFSYSEDNFALIEHDLETVFLPSAVCDCGSAPDSRHVGCLA